MLLLLWISYISIQMIAILDLGEILITQDLDTNMMLLKMWLFFKISSTTSAVIGILVFLATICLEFLIYFLIIWRSRGDVTLLVTIVTYKSSEWIKSTLISDLMLCNNPLILVTWLLLFYMNFNLLSLLIGIIICFLNGLFVVILSLCLDLLMLLIIFWVFSILFALRFRNISLILRTSLVVEIFCLDA